jgi:ABC-type uncharacterized transport system substrate-binding protein
LAISELTNLSGDPLFVKANKIKVIAPDVSEEDNGAIVTLEYDVEFSVRQTPQMIFELLEAIHPSLR